MLAGYRAKIARANEFIAELERSVEVGRGQDFRVVTEIESGPRSRIVFRAKVERDAMMRLGVIVGDVAHNLRSALDHAVWQLVMTNGADPGRHTMFPIIRSAAEFQERGLRQLRGVAPAAVAVIEEVQPYHMPSPDLTPEDSFLWLLDELSNHDKHRVLNVTAGRVAGWTIAFPSLTSSSIGAGMPNPDAFGPLEDGAIIHVIEAASPTALDRNYEIQLGIAFTDNGPGRGQFVIKLLKGLEERVVTIVDRLVPFIS